MMNTIVASGTAFFDEAYLRGEREEDWFMEYWRYVKIHNEPLLPIPHFIRRIRPCELAKFFSYPDWYDWGDLAPTTKVKIIGNSVPVGVGRALAKAIREAFS